MYFESNSFSDTLKLELIDLLRHVKHVSCSLFYGNTLLPFVFSVCFLCVCVCVCVSL